ncbi:MAG: cell division protein FtsA [Acidobacteria bacterium]|nr:cell division protein FtsA [Acidobacteriota bacterium]MBV9476212.1 cell division protein FtsA [Acidobacteriota bacterium]
MSRTEDKYIVALDIGTSKVCALVGEINDRGHVEIIGKGTSPMKGTRRGNIINLDQAIDAVKKAVDEAEVMAGLQIESAYVGVAGDHIRSVNSRGVVSVMGKHKEIGREDIDRVIEASKSIAIPAELELLHVIPREFVVDGQDGIHDPLGMTATRLEANVHIVTGARTHDQNILTCVNKAGIAVHELVLEQLAAAEAVLTQDEREMGVLLMDIGGGTTDYAVFLEGNVVHTNVLPVGAGHFTSDISVVLRTPMEDAERIKKRYGCALASLVTEDDPIEVPTVGGRAPKILSRQELTGILEPRAAEIAKLVYRDLEKVGLDKEIRSGVVLVGGGAEMDGMVEMVEQVFDQQARRGVPRGVGGLSDTVGGPEWAAAVGLLLWGLKDQSRVRKRPRKGLAKVADSFKSLFAWT